MASKKKVSRAAASGAKTEKVSAPQPASASVKAASAKAASAKAASAKTASVRSGSAKAPLPKPTAKAAPKPARLGSAPVAKATSLESSEVAAGVGEGGRVPNFSAKSSAGVISNVTLKGKPFVLYFYPKDDTPGCTREACAFRDMEAKFKAKGVQILGVSPDSSESHGRFGEKYGLKFTLLSDPDKSVAMAFGVWVKKQNYGREYMGVSRSTFLVDASGKVRRVWRNVKVDGHVEQVLEAAASLG